MIVTTTVKKRKKSESCIVNFILTITDLRVLWDLGDLSNLYAKITNEGNDKFSIRLVRNPKPGPDCYKLKIDRFTTFGMFSVSSRVLGITQPKLNYSSKIYYKNFSEQENPYTTKCKVIEFSLKPLLLPKDKEMVESDMIKDVLDSIQYLKTKGYKIRGYKKTKEDKFISRIEFVM